jgi:hypothetical protein
MTHPTQRLDLSAIKTFNRNAEWSAEKKEAINKAIAMYPNIPQIAIEVAYDFSLKYDGDTQMEKYLKGEFLSKNERRTLRKKINPKNYKIERTEYRENEELKTVNLIKAETKAIDIPKENNAKSWYNIF